MNSIRGLLLKELAAAYHAEQQFVAILTKWQKTATNGTLKLLMHKMTKDSEWNWNQIPKIFQAFNVNPRSRKCREAEALAGAGEQLAGDFRRSNVVNSALVSAAFKIGYHKEAAYRSLHEWASLLINEEAVGLLGAILEKEKHSNQALAASARTIFKDEALSAEMEAVHHADQTGKVPTAWSINTRLFNLSRPMPILM